MCNILVSRQASKKLKRTPNMSSTGNSENKGGADETKTRNHISWDQYFMGVALLAAERKKGPKLQAGACVVNRRKRIVRIGYAKADEKFDWSKGETDDENKDLFFCHAEMNAIVNKFNADLHDCKLYSTLFPCNKCSQLIIQSGIRKVIYLENEYSDSDSIYKASEVLLLTANVKIKKYQKQEILEKNFFAAFEQDLCASEKTNGEEHLALGHDKDGKDRMESDQYFMGVALISSYRSKDPKTKVGACIINSTTKCIVGTGYNGMPDNCILHNDDRFPWTKEADYAKDKHLYVCHAEMNAIVNKFDRDGQNCTLYTTLHPCHDCSKLIIQSGIIKDVVYLNEISTDKENETQTTKKKRRYEASNKMLKENRVETRKFDPLGNMNEVLKAFEKL